MHKVLLQNFSPDFETLKKIEKENSYGRKARKIDTTKATNNPFLLILIFTPPNFI